MAKPKGASGKQIGGVDGIHVGCRMSHVGCQMSDPTSLPVSDPVGAVSSVG